MKIGLGCTVLANGRSSGHLDGIGVYTAEILAKITAAGMSPPLPVVFGQKAALSMPGCHILPGPYVPVVAASVLTHLPFAGTARLEERIDLFHAPDHHIPRLRRVPVVATIMDVIGLRHPEWVNPRLRALKNRVFRQATGWARKVITISDFSAVDISDCLGIPPERIVSIPLGVDEAFYRPVEAQVRAEVLYRNGLEPGFFLFVGTLQPRKNVVRLIQAHASLPEEVRRRHPLVIVGQNGWRTGELLGLLDKLQASGSGRWIRYVSRNDLFALLQSAHAMVFPSLYEGFGLPILEAFASGTPVVASNTTSLPEVTGDAAWLVDPARVDSIADGMLRAVQDTVTRQVMVERGLARAREFTWQKTAERTLAVYRSLA